MDYAKPKNNVSQIAVRAVTAFVLIGIVLAVIVFGGIHTITAFVFLTFCVAHYEMRRLHPKIKAEKGRFINRYAWLAAVFVWPAWPGVFFTILTILVLMAPLWDWWRMKSNADFAETLLISAYKTFALCYIAMPLWFVYKMLFLPQAKFLLLLAIGCTAIGDSAAYLGGRAFGKRKLAPRISPNKTVEGAVCALMAGSFGSALIHYSVMPLRWEHFIVGFLIALVGIIGDLSESALKRSFGVKDSGSFLPGHGGMLDRIDAYLFTLPFVYFYGLWMAL